MKHWIKCHTRTHHHSHLVAQLSFLLFQLCQSQSQLSAALQLLLPQYLSVLGCVRLCALLLDLRKRKNKDQKRNTRGWHQTENKRLWWTILKQMCRPVRTPVPLYWAGLLKSTLQPGPPDDSWPLKINTPCQSIKLEFVIVELWLRVNFILEAVACIMQLQMKSRKSSLHQRTPHEKKPKPTQSYSIFLVLLITVCLRNRMQNRQQPIPTPSSSEPSDSWKNIG